MKAQGLIEGLERFRYAVRLPTVIRFQRVEVTIRGEYLAPSLEAAQAAVTASELELISVRPMGRWGRGASLRSGEDLVLLMAQLRTLLAAGYPLPENLRRMGRERAIDSLPLRVALMIVAADIESGLSPAEAFARHPRVIPASLCAALEAADPAARIGALLDELLDSRRRLGVLRRVLLYPAVLVVGFLLFGWLQAELIMPSVRGVYADAGLPLGGVLQRLLFLACRFFPILARLALPAMLLVLVYRLARPLDFDRWLGRMPGYGRVRRARSLALACRSMAADLGARLSLAQALRRASELTPDGRVRRGLLLAGEGADSGEPTARLLEKHLHPLFGATPDATANWPLVLDALGRIFEGEAESAFERLRKVIMPLCVVVIGIASGVLAAHFFTLMQHIYLWLLGAQ
jgi:type II secretory pathway component PulF